MLADVLAHLLACRVGHEILDNGILAGRGRKLAVLASRLAHRAPVVTMGNLDWVVGIVESQKEGVDMHVPLANVAGGVAGIGQDFRQRRIRKPGAFLADRSDVPDGPGTCSCILAAQQGGPGR